MSAQAPVAEPRTVWTNGIGMSFVTIPAGTFTMGAPFTARAPTGDDDATVTEYDEAPAHRVTLSNAFQMAVTPVTNRQYERFDPDHAGRRGYLGFSRDDDEAVVQVSWHDAVAFCAWLSRRDGRPYRLATEAEWEYAARACTTTPFWTGETLPNDMQCNQRMTWYPDPTEGPYDLAQETPSLRVGQTPANPWGLRDIHGLVEEWCLDWYGPYPDRDVRDPLGPAAGDVRVTRGGSHSTEVRFLRSGNRAGALPEDRSWLTGFRVAIGDLPEHLEQSVPEPTAVHLTVNTAPVRAATVDTAPFFRFPVPYVKIPADSHGPLFSRHNHCPTIAECRNGDLLAVWFSCERESGREMTLAASRLRQGNDEWDDASLFWDAPDRNMTGAFLRREGDVLHCYAALGIAGTWGQMIITHRQSLDSGASWSPTRIIIPDHANGQAQPANLPFRARNGTLVLPGDDNAVNGSRLYLSHDNGATWSIPPGRIDGIHAAVRQKRRGRTDRVRSPLSARIGPDAGQHLPRYGADIRAVMVSVRRHSWWAASGPVAAARRAVPALFLCASTGVHRQRRARTGWHGDVRGLVLGWRPLLADPQAPDDGSR